MTETAPKTAAKTAARLRFEGEIQRSFSRLQVRAIKRVGVDAADDLVMDVYAEALGMPEAKWKAVRDPANWVFGVLDNHVLRHKYGRRGAEAAATESYSALEDDENYCAITLKVDDFAGDLVDQMAEDQEVKRQVDQIMAMVEIAGFNRREHYVFVARLREVGYPEIAKALGISVPSARAYYSQATAKVAAVAKEQALNGEMAPGS